MCLKIGQYLASRHGEQANAAVACRRCKQLALPGPDRLEELPSMRDQIVQADLELVAVLEVLLQSAFSRSSFAAVVTCLVLHDRLAVLTPPAPIPVEIHR